MRLLSIVLNRLLELTAPLLIVTTVCGCGGDAVVPARDVPSAPQPAWVADVTAESKLEFRHDPGPLGGNYFLPQINGSGAALLDFDNDGRLDIYLLQGGGPNSTATNALFHQQPDGTFADVSQGSGLDVNGTNAGVAVGDVNNDGYVDVVVTQYLGAKLFLNEDGARFTDATKQSGLSNPYWGTSASFLDYDRDGWLDLVIINYVAFEEARHCVLGGGRDYCRPNVFEGTPAMLARNRGLNENGVWLGYEDRTTAAGLDRVRRAGMGVVCADFNGDRWPDIFVANDMQANCLWMNQQNGTFQDEAVARGVAYNARGQAVSNMGAAYGDVNGDGLGDLFVTLFTNERHALWKQQPRGAFREETATAGLTKAAWHGTGWGTVLADFDQDSALDVALVNGFVDRQDVPEGSYWTPYMDRNQVFANDGSGKFRDVSVDNPALCGQPNVGRGLCVGDIDGDGALDLLVTQIAGPARILRNVASDRGHWLLVRAYDPALQRDAIGAEIRVQADGRTWSRVVQPGQSFQCSNDMRAHFGLGAVDRIEFIEVLWPDGSTERFPSTAVDCRVEVRRGAGEPVSAKQ
jgi:enediyne biosynthesis protein E4